MKINLVEHPLISSLTKQVLQSLQKKKSTRDMRELFPEDREGCTPTNEEATIVINEHDNVDTYDFKDLTEKVQCSALP